MMLLATSSLAADWSQLDRYQQTITRREFDRLLSTVYCPSGAFTNYLAYSTNSVAVFSTPAKMFPPFTPQFVSPPSLPSPTPRGYPEYGQNS